MSSLTVGFGVVRIRDLEGECRSCRVWRFRVRAVTGRLLGRGILGSVGPERAQH